MRIVWLFMWENRRGCRYWRTKGCPNEFPVQVHLCTKKKKLDLINKRSLDRTSSTSVGYFMLEFLDGKDKNCLGLSL